MRVKMALGSTLTDKAGKVLAEPGQEVDVDDKTGRALLHGRSAEEVEPEEKTARRKER